MSKATASRDIWPCARGASLPGRAPAPAHPGRARARRESPSRLGCRGPCETAPPIRPRSPSWPSRSVRPVEARQSNRHRRSLRSRFLEDAGCPRRWRAGTSSRQTAWRKSCRSQRPCAITAGGKASRDRRIEGGDGDERGDARRLVNAKGRFFGLSTRSREPRSGSREFSFSRPHTPNSRAAR
jgi:hypothetical protein